MTNALMELADLPPLPPCWTGSPVSVTWAEDGEVSVRNFFTDEQMRAYGLACIEAAQLCTAANRGDGRCAHQFVLDQEAPRTSCCQLCGKTVTEGEK